MATTRISSQTASFILQDPLTWNKQIISLNGNLNAATLSGGSPSGSSLLIIYKGTPETFPSFTDRATRASDVLITFSLGATTASFTGLGDVGGTHVRFVIGKCLTLTSATASGLASWFLLVRAGTTSLTDKGAMLGTVGLVGTGADLEISSTNIVSGEYYTSAGIYINIPHDWTV